MTVRFETAVPVLPCADVKVSLAWWISVCGFTEEFSYGNPLSYAGISRDTVRIRFALVGGLESARTVGDQTMLRIQVAELEEWFVQYQARGGKVHPNGDLTRKPWGSLEFAAIDPCGVCVTFFG